MKKTHVLRAGTGEKIQYLVHAFNDNTIRFVLCYPGLLNADLLSQAVRALVQSVDILHASFRVTKRSARWELHEAFDESDYFRFMRADDPTKAALDFSLAPAKPGDKVQLHCLLAQNEHASAIALCMSHLCVDGIDGLYLLNKLAEAYNLLLKTGNCRQLAVKNGSRAAEQVYQKLTVRQILSLMKNPLPGVKSAFPFAEEDPGTARIVTHAIPQSIMNAARKKARAAGATANDLLLTACYHALYTLRAADEHTPMSILSMMDLRRHCRDGQSAGLCNMTGSLPTALTNGISPQFEDTMQEIARQTQLAKNNPLAGLEGMPLLHGAARILPMGLLLFAAGKVYGSMSVGLTNLGNIDCAPLIMGDLRPDAGYFGGPAKKKPAMQISAASFDGQCVLSILGQFTAQDAQKLRMFLNSVSLQIQQYAGAKKGSDVCDVT